MIIHLNFKSGVPAYLQIVQQVKAAAAAGKLQSGDALPSVRALAEELRINRNTASKAYSELEAEGVIETRQGSGCYLKASSVSPLTRTAKAERLAPDIDSLIVQAHQLQLSTDELLSLIQRRLQAFESRKLQILEASKQP